MLTVAEVIDVLEIVVGPAILIFALCGLLYVHIRFKADTTACIADMRGQLKAAHDEMQTMARTQLVGMCNMGSIRLDLNLARKDIALHHGMLLEPCTDVIDGREYKFAGSIARDVFRIKSAIAAHRGLMLKFNDQVKAQIKSAAPKRDKSGRFASKPVKRALARKVGVR